MKLKHYIADLIKFTKDFVSFLSEFVMFTLYIVSWPFVIFAEFIIYIFQSLFNKKNYRD